VGEALKITTCLDEKIQNVPFPLQLSMKIREQTPRADWSEVSVAIHAPNSRTSCCPTPNVLDEEPITPSEAPR
jgi:hypothetical protein